MKAGVVVAVLLVIGVLARTDISPVVAMLCGLAAVTCLSVAYTRRWPSQILPALLLGCVALLAAAIPAGHSYWLPLITPVAIVGIFVLALWPFTQGSGGAVE